jgi:flagellar protein FlaF
VGFSVSGATAIIFVGAFISVGMIYTAASNGYEVVSDAQTSVHEDALARQNTALNVTNASYDAGTLTVTVRNTGSTALSVNDTDVVVDNEYVTTFESRTVEGDAQTDLWLPGENLTATVDRASVPTRVKVVTEYGVSETEGL